MTLLVNGKPIDYEADGLIPEYMRGAMERYMEYGIDPGSFLMAVLSNNLMGAARQADGMNMYHLYEYCYWLANYAPFASYGSPENVKRWMEGRQKENLKSERDSVNKEKYNIEPLIQEYKGKYICRFGFFYRVKNNPSDSFAIHHKSFDSAKKAMEYIDAKQKENKT